MKRNRKWWDIRAQAQAGGGKVAEIRIYGDIGFWGTDAQNFVSQLDAAATDASAITVAINSMGGDVFDAFAIYNALRRHAGKVKGRVDGIAASAASLVLMACDEIEMPENALLMIHHPHTVAAGESKDLRRVAELLDNASAGILAAYVARSGQSEDDVRAMMDAETWLTAAQAKEKGFCDVIEAPVKLAASAGAAPLLARFSAVPEQVCALLDAVGEPDAEPIVPPDPTPEPQSPDVAALASHVFNSLREANLAACAEGVIAATGLRDRETVDRAIRNATDIAGICLAANQTDLTAQYVADGLTPDQVRARLFERLTASSARINSRPDPAQRQTQPQARSRALRTSDIYAARRVAK
ncbi:Clp protease ClpP [Burkholderia thailandensis]|uniref:ATP-dependent Clp protease proteolytic subunit n=2 Tax=Burkholderia thailandensis TaxID=57975 RepID=A0AAW9CY93_BURTH|nr:head maturation protease, ClpP-related [Burkholderia thailandensis]MCS3394158.1 Clp protease ClpP [Burkholderia thailandensis]MCS6427426.1 Clp protease ClpP [Burkholderia thailandensis]MCS6455644.1 Clp protease ClpP [Burkholderia thailandensis]MCS6466591.1 Clp protease ClpP [Burkholderia thailandensis]MCS6485242.1 Clp protease ClpP [Burkholderia thailandensis]